MTKNVMYRQGDLLFTHSAGFNAEAMVPLGRRPADQALVLALGEKTGHDHTITEPSVELYEDEQGTMWARVTGEVAEVKHQEHGTQTLPKGDYRVTQQQAMVGENALAVVD